MTESRPRRPLIAAIPFAAIALLAVTAATAAPQPPRAAGVLVADQPGPAPSRDEIMGMILTLYPSVVRGDSAVGRVALLLSDSGYVLASRADKAVYGTAVAVYAPPTAKLAEARAREERAAVVDARDNGANVVGRVDAAGTLTFDTLVVRKKLAEAITRDGMTVSEAPGVPLIVRDERSPFPGVNPGSTMNVAEYVFEAGELGPNRIVVNVSRLRPGLKTGGSK